MKKRITGLLICLILTCLLLTGCGKTPVGIKLTDIVLTEEEYAFGVDKNQPELLEQANAFIRQSQLDGTLDAICQRNFGDGEPQAVYSAQPDGSKNQLTVATNAMFEPFEYVRGNAYYGVDMELAAAFAEYLGCELVIVDMDFEAVCLSVSQGKCDIAMAGLTVNESRKAHVVFTEPYYQASQIIMTPEGDTTFDGCTTAEQVEALLSGMGSEIRIGVQGGTTGQYYLEGDEDWNFAGFDVTCVQYNSVSLAAQDMLHGNLDFVMADTEPAAVVAQSLGTQDSFESKLQSFWGQMSDGGGYRLILEGLGNTLIIALVGLFMGIVIGTLIAAVRVMPKYRRLPRLLNGLCSLYVGFFRGTPIVAQLLLGYYVLLPLLGLNYPALWVAAGVFGLNSGAYVSEIMRGGIRSVDPGQLEAGRAVGLPFSSAMLHIVLPQAVKNILPTLGNELISLIKETSVVSFISAVDIYKAFNVIATNSYEYVVPYLAMALVYIVLVAGVSALVKWMERRLACHDRHSASK